MTIEFDSTLNYHGQGDSEPIISVPLINIDKLAAANIIDDF